MILNESTLRELYPNLDEKQYQPAGIDLTLGEVAEIKHDDGMVYGVLKDGKVLPKHEKVDTINIQIGGMIKSAFRLMPHKSYIATTTEKIDISTNSGQFYLPRSSLLRAGIDVRTAFGDPGFHGHLSFLLINHTDELFFIEQGARFAQLIDIKTLEPTTSYDGDYNE